MERYHPTYSLTVGIAAVFESAGVKLGDVVVAKTCYYDEPGKAPPGGKQPAHEQILTSQSLCAFSQNYQHLDWTASVRWSSPATNCQFSVHYGLIVSSETVIADKQIMASLLAGHLESEIHVVSKHHRHQCRTSTVVGVRNLFRFQTPPASMLDAYGGATVFSTSVAATFHSFISKFVVL